MAQIYGPHIATDGLVLSLDASDVNSYPAPIIVSVQAYSVYGGGLRSANYTVQFSDDNSTWTTAFTGVMSNNSSCGIITGTGVGSGAYGRHRYWRYVEGSAVASHHPRVSRIDLIDINGTVRNLVTYTSDNCSDSGTYIVGTVSADLGGTTWTDTSGNSNNGTLTNGPTFSSNDSSYILTDGVNDYINFGQKFQYQDLFSVECWVKWTSTPTQTGACGIFAPIFTNKDYGWNLHTNGSNTIVWNIYNLNSAAQSITTSGTYLNQWVHIVGYKSGTTMGLYVNGVSQGTATLSTNSIYYVAYDCSIGGNHPCGGVIYYMAVRTSIARVYTRPLSAQEILQNYNAQKSRFNL